MTIEDLAEWVFNDWGFQAQKLPTGANQTPDFLVSGSTAKFVVELKTKEDDPQGLIERENALRDEGFYTKWESDRRTNTLSGIARDAAEQLEARSKSADFKVIWFLALGEDPARKSRKFESTLLGTSPLADFGVHPLTSKPCYFFGFNDFFRHKEILDAAIISYPKFPHLCSRLCLNPFSPRHARFRASELTLRFPAGVLDPEEEESAGRGYIADTDGDRRNPTSILEYVRRKYLKPRLDLAEMSTLSMDTRRRRRA